MIDKKISLQRLGFCLLLAFVLGVALLILLQSPQQHRGHRIWLESAELLADNRLSAIVAHPEGAGPHPAVVLLHGCFGISNKHYQWSKRLNQWGYTTLMIDSFSQRGITQICTEDDKVWRHFNQQRPKETLVALKYLQSHHRVDANKIGLIGWSYGGTIALKTLEQRDGIASNDYRAGIAFYPSCWQFKQYQMSKRHYRAAVPLRILIGENDDWTKPAHCRMLLDGNENKSKLQLLTYAGAYHNFDDRQQRYQLLKSVRLESALRPLGDVRVGYNKQADVAAQAAVRDFLSVNLKNRSRQ